MAGRGAARPRHGCVRIEHEPARARGQSSEPRSLRQRPRPAARHHQPTSLLSLLHRIAVSRNCIEWAWEEAAGENCKGPCQEPWANETIAMAMSDRRADLRR